MRIAALALIATLAACNPSAPGNSGGPFPNLANASFRAEATAYDDNGQSIPIVMIRSGNKVRMEFNAAEGQMVVVNNGEAGENFALMSRDGATMAMDVPDSDYTDPVAQWNAEFASSATRTGTCNVAGETGAEWTHAGNGTPTVGCVTDDGIILRSTEGDRVVWETTQVTRGPQDASLFVVPPGVQRLNLGAMMGQAAAAGGRVTPEICQTLRGAGAPADALAQAGC